MSKQTTTQLHLFKIFLFCCFLINYNFTNAQVEMQATICLGDSILVEVPSELPEGPPGPTDPDGNPTYYCTHVVDVAISPTDGVSSQSNFSFWLSPTFSTTYTLTSTSGPFHLHDVCFEQSETFQVSIQVEDCNEPEPPAITRDTIVFEYEACIGDTIVLPTVLPGACPQGAFPPEDIVNFISFTTDENSVVTELIAIVQEAGDIYFSIPQTPPPGDTTSCNTDVHLFKITLKNDCEINTSTITEITSCAGGNVRLPIPGALDSPCQNTNVSISPMTEIQWQSDYSFNVTPTTSTVYTITAEIEDSESCDAQIQTAQFDIEVIDCSSPDTIVFEYEACIGDTIAVPTVLPGPCPQGAYPPIDILSWIDSTIESNVVTEIIGVVVGFGDVYFSIPQDLPPGAPGPCNSDVHNYKIIPKEDCETQPTVDSGNCLCDVCGYSTPLEIPWVKSFLEVTVATRVDVYWNYYNEVYLFSPVPYYTSGIALYKCDGTFQCYTPNDDFSIFPTSGGCATQYVGTVYQSELETYCDEEGNEYDSICAIRCEGKEAYGCNNPNDPIEQMDSTTLSLFEDFPWLTNFVDPSNCCDNLAVLEFPMGSYSFIYIKTDSDCGGYGSLYLNNGYSYCNDADNFDCLGAYGLNESDGNVLYYCGEEPMEPIDTVTVSFDEYPWLLDIIDTDDCCANRSIQIFPLGGSYSFIYVKAADECGGLGSLYLNNGELYCNDANNFDCLGAYGFNENNGTTFWNCGTPIDPNNPIPTDDYPWLSSIVNAEDCCANTNIFYYKKDNLTHGYIYIMAGDCQDDNYGRLYNEEGQLYCTSTSTISCFEHYDLGNSFIEELLWSCDGTDARPNQSTDDGNSRLISENISLGLNVFPNPSAGLINIEINTGNNYEGEQIISVYDINGRIVHQNRFDTANVKLFQADLSDLTDGIYIVEYKNANVSSAQKIMIRH